MLTAAITGDYSANGFMDAADYVTWRASLHTSVATPGDVADGNQDGLIGPEDYQVWRAGFGQLAGDYSANGFVDAADYVTWRASGRSGLTSAASVGINSTIKPEGYDIWRSNFGLQGSSQPIANWFDANIHDAALQSLGHNLYVDGLIDRNDMLALLTNAKDDGAVDAIEFADLKTIANNAALFGSLDYVRQLSSYVVLGNTANAQYQTSTLGNLVAGSSATQLQNLVNKWFLGLDRPETPYTYALTSGTLFVDGANYADINQGNLRDCYLLASLAETALKTPATITNMFVVNGDGTYTVRIYNNSQPAYVTVDSYLPVDGAGKLTYAGTGTSSNDAGNELWVSLVEKAYAQINEMGWLRGYLAGNGQNSYAAIENGYIYAALGQITGQGTVAFSTTLVPTNFTAFVDAYNQGKLIGFSSNRTPASPSVVSDHSYAVLQYDAANQTITLFNPWGIQFGLLTMTWSEIQGNFSHFDRTG
jgi:hypothetical protein